MPVSKGHAIAASTNSSIEPYWRSECGRAVVYLGDCRQILPKLNEEQFHAVVTDPPYELKFMNKGWDGSGVTYDQKTWSAVLRVAKPGAHLLSFGGTRTYHRITCAIEDAGWEIRDCVMWVYGSGYPKSMDISKAIDKKLGAKRKQVRTPMSPNGNVLMDKIGAHRPWKEAAKVAGYHEHDSSEPVTEAAKHWHGWGTTLKPAYEPVVLARKALAGTAAECVMEHSAGALNIDACRIGTTGTDVTREVHSKPSSGSGVYRFNDSSSPSSHMSNGGFTKTHKDGRWPANLIHDGSEEVTFLFPQEAARFFYTAKADDSDRPHGDTTDVIHPTVKPVDLMQYMVRLVCVRGGKVLDLFMGSGSTGCAAIAEGMEFVGIEQSQEYADIAIGKIKLALESAPALVKPISTAPSIKPLAQSRPEIKKLRGT